MRCAQCPTTLATFNIDNIATRLAVLLEWLTKASPDIVCLQELDSGTRSPSLGACDCPLARLGALLSRLPRSGRRTCRSHGRSAVCLDSSVSCWP